MLNKEKLGYKNILWTHSSLTGDPGRICKVYRNKTDKEIHHNFINEWNNF